jgi:subtilisin family serine protease
VHYEAAWGSAPLQQGQGVRVGIVDTGVQASHEDLTGGGIGGAPQVTLVPARVLGSNGSGSIANVINGIMWAANPAQGNVDVINLSLGSPQCSETLFQALYYAVHNNGVRSRPRPATARARPSTCTRPRSRRTSPA